MEACILPCFDIGGGGEGKFYPPPPNALEQNFRKYCGALYTGASPGFGKGGGQEIFFSDLGICMSQSDMRIARRVRGHAPLRNFFKTVQFGAF